MSLTEAGSATTLWSAAISVIRRARSTSCCVTPLNNVFDALLVAVDGGVADQVEVDVPLADRHARVVAERVACLARRGDELCAGAKVANPGELNNRISRDPRGDADMSASPDRGHTICHPSGYAI